MPKVSNGAPDLAALKADLAKANGDTPHDDKAPDDVPAADIPETVVIDGVTYYRTPPAPVAKPSKPGYDDVTVNLAPYTDRIMLDGKMFFHGFTYTVTEKQAASMREIMSRTWIHEASTGGANMNAYQRQRNVALSPQFPNGRSS